MYDCVVYDRMKFVQFIDVFYDSMYWWWNSSNFRKCKFVIRFKEREDCKESQTSTALQTSDKAKFQPTTYSELWAQGTKS